MFSDKTIKSIKHLLYPYRINILIICIAMLFASLGSFLNPWLTMRLIDFGILDTDITLTIRYLIAMLGVFIFQQIINLIQFKFYREISIKIPYDLNHIAGKHILSAKVKYYNERNVSAVITEIFQDIANISSLAGTQFLTSFIMLIKIIAGISALIIINWQLALIMLAVIPIKLTISTVMFKKQEKVHKMNMKLQSMFSSWLGDSIGGIIEIKMWGLLPVRLNELNRILNDGNRAKSKIMTYGYIESVLAATLSIVFTCVLYLFGAISISNNIMTMGMLVTFISYSAFVFEPINLMSYLISQLSKSKPALERFMKFISSESEADPVESIELDSFNELSDISFQNVTLAYDTEKVLEDVSFTIRKGERVAIIGLNGSGKSSIINLLLRFYEPSEGRILLNGCDIRGYTFSSYRKLWGYMGQKNYFFHDTIENNINITRCLTKDDITENMKKSGALAFVSKLPEKEKTLVGYNGNKLSGGEKQKIALTRTLAKKNSKILLLDEPTSSFDYYSEQLFTKEILMLSQYDVLIIITHRPEMLKAVDKIIYMKSGKVAGIGSYEDLNNSLDCFAKMISNFQLEVHES